MKAVSSSQVEDCLRSILEAEGFDLTPKLRHGQHGADVIASKDGVSHHLEVIGCDKTPWKRSKDFYEGFFRTVSRLNDGAQSCVLVLSHLNRRGLPRRARQHFEAWKRIGEAFPELEIRLGDTDIWTYRRSPWNEWANK